MSWIMLSALYLAIGIVLDGMFSGSDSRWRYDDNQWPTEGRAVGRLLVIVFWPGVLFLIAVAREEARSPPKKF